MAQNQFRTYPKRRIERVRSRINHTVTNASITNILHTVEDRKTLVRTIIDLRVYNIVAADHAVNLVIHRLPRGQTVGNPLVTENLDADQIKENIWEALVGRFGISQEPIHIHADLKSMRKLDPGDQVVLKTVSDGVDTDKCVGTIVQMFKE